jgi:hypothetical protein
MEPGVEGKKVASHEVASSIGAMNPVVNNFSKSYFTSVT